uniref:Programmed cell death protein 4 n=1 Tax=Acrobeloides nanus TaxID=290746 RepID=A0A914C8A0_9BILA
MSSNGHKKVQKKFEDPELEAEVYYAKENGLKPPTKLPSDTAKEKLQKDLDKSEEFAVDGMLQKNLKNAKAERKARSRGVSGCSTKKDGGRFEYGLDCVDLAYDDNHSDVETSDVDDYVEYSDYVCNYNNKKIKSVILEYFVNGNFEDALSAIEPFTLTKDLSERTISDIIILSLEGDASWYELAAALLEKMIENQWVTTQSVDNTLEDILERLDDIILDNPNAIETVAIIMAKLVDDNIINDKTIQSMKLKLSKNVNAKKCLETSASFVGNRHLLKGKWVPSGGHQSLSVLSKEFKLILVEYLQSNDIEVASNRIKELKVPHFNHDMVYQASIMALEKMHDVIIVQLIKLLKYMVDNGQLYPSCIEKDLPAAYSLARRWVNKCREEKLISEKIVGKCPSRGRTRTLSCGPDGKLSVEDDDVTAITNVDEGRHDACNGIALPSMEVASDVAVH